MTNLGPIDRDGWDVFAQVWQRVKDKTHLTGQQGRMLFFKASIACKHAPGAVLSVGAGRGGVAGIIGVAAKDRKVYAADVFDDVPMPAGSFLSGRIKLTPQEQVWSLLDGLGVSDWALLDGQFPRETGRDLSGPLAFAHIDKSACVQEAFDLVWPLVSPRGIVVVPSETAPQAILDHPCAFPSDQHKWTQLVKD